MINKNTVLILGAGASYQYGYPLGTGLKRSILEFVKIQPSLLHEIQNSKQFFHSIKNVYNLSQGHPKELAEYLILKKNFSSFDINLFYNNFLTSHKPSIDTFLEDRPELLEIGKILIAMSIFQCESGSVELLFNDDEKNWYKYLMKELCNPKGRFLENKLSVITYNYDTSLETFLVTDLQHTYGGMSMNESVNKVNDTITIKHVHGRSGEYSWKLGRSMKDYTSTDVDEAVKRLFVIFEEDEVKESYKDVHKILSQAENIFILGFGFDDRNLERLDLAIHTKNARVFATRTGLSDLEIKKINSKVDDKILFSKDENHDIVSFFRREVNLHGNYSDEFIGFNNEIRKHKF